jgi:CheY-like chemotaxis protein
MHPTGQPPQVFVTNHSAEFRDQMRDLLTDEGYRVTLANRDAQPLDSIAALAPDLIVIDYRWPSAESEWTLLNLLRTDPRTRAIPCILCTAAVAQVRGMEDHLRAMGIRIISKPFGSAALVGAVRLALVEARTRDSQAATPDGELEALDLRRGPGPDEEHARREEMRPDPWQATAAHLRFPMTVMLGRSQLLQRQIRSGQVGDAAACLETLMAIDEAIREMEFRLGEAEAGRF